MCWAIYSDSRPVELVAETDIEVRKIVFGIGEDSYISRYENFPYLRGKYGLGKRLVLNEESKDPGLYSIYKGFHSYGKKCKIMILNSSSIYGYRVTYNDMINDDGIIPLYPDGPTLEVIDCVIPKGARYYVNEKKDEYVSDEIVIKGVSSHFDIKNLNF